LTHGREQDELTFPSIFHNFLTTPTLQTVQVMLKQSTVISAGNGHLEFQVSKIFHEGSKHFFVTFLDKRDNAKLLEKIYERTTSF
jgi:hypothetical protein